ncbi:hypothetical protein L1987_19799 [Smallanthus sonchifolius]|uniref:Uncharacterized protein n=1 Tax=Smallanthus sonchifolius TaxID=185202 RepID=A0ACB9IPL4_9ASTR|nr:hypothetical protein L1987_19799 [Smallanthus sonchifolius]
MAFANTNSFFYWTDDEDVDATVNAPGDAKHTLEASPVFLLRRANEIRLDSTGAQDLDKLLISTLFERNPLLGAQSHSTFKDWLEKLPDNVVVIGSQTHTDSRKEKVLNRTGLECDGLETLCIKDQLLTNEGMFVSFLLSHNICVEKIVGWALSHHLMQHAKADPDARLVLSNESIQYDVEILQAIQNESKSLKKSLKKRLLADVIPPSDIGVTFNDIGALEKLKKS